MDTQKVAAEYRMSQWAQIIQARADSRQSIKDFCQAEVISRNAYFYWLKKLRESACTELVKKEEPRSISPGGWVQLASGPMQQTTEALKIEINGCHITVTAETDHDLLSKVCHTLRSL
ncbi:IS66 family insertion sequence element accessory protein TnpA [Sinanaerobacter chloroacetimidivorans]|uniref:IS66 family insertion sequence element accessory protein TnpB n=1 Tax=Sinanaerobacter chloroacetimidivorans TaxID=2818044 RepID=A0A8J7W834_9FIRM|nr:IS66 family insertion sequence element accessory protein TnpB [Sinanaerobacter chloroacetimidivorans]MBR0600661.1 IS66 family insertion sequence element accessory protein TnpB [Sinanaerobacter chloroacetimidivorans]